MFKRMIVAVLAAMLVAGCVKSPTASVEQRHATPGAAFDETPPPLPSASGGIGGMGSGN